MGSHVVTAPARAEMAKRSIWNRLGWTAAGLMPGIIISALLGLPVGWYAALLAALVFANCVGFVEGRET